MVWLCAVPASAQFPGADAVLKGAKVISDITITPEEEHEIGQRVSQNIRQRYGVVQDKDVHRYVTLVGTVLAGASSKPGLPWRFIVLDTDGVNAFAAPGGFIHVTRGALALMASEAELGGVLAHEIVHVTQQHTVNALKKSRLSQAGIQEGASRAPGGGLGEAVISKLAERATEMVLAGFGRGEELESDDKGIVLANKVGYAPAGLGAFLTRLSDRNKASSQRQGLFASHPEMKERFDRLSKGTAALKPASTATLEERFRQFITYESKPQADIAQVEGGAAGLTGSGTTSGSGAAETKPAAKDEAKTDEPPKKKGLFGMGTKTFSGGDEKKSAQVTGSGGSRGVDTERNAKGGANPALVRVSVTAADLQQFKTQGALR
jgi:predicted Zn-dependent protease